MNILTFENLDGTELSIKIPENLHEISFAQLMALQNPELTDLGTLSILSGVVEEDLYNAKSYQLLTDKAKMYIELFLYATNKSSLEKLPNKINVIYNNQVKKIKLPKRLSMEPAGAFMAAKDIISREIDVAIELFGLDEWQNNFSPSYESCAAIVNEFLFCNVTGAPWNEVKPDFSDYVKKAENKPFDVAHNMSAFDVLAIAKYFFNAYPELHGGKETLLNWFLNLLNQKITEISERRLAMKIKTANALFDDEIFGQMYRAGFITGKIFLHREIFLWVNTQISTRSISKNQAVLEAEAKFKKSERTIWKVLKSFS